VTPEDFLLDRRNGSRCQSIKGAAQRPPVYNGIMTDEVQPQLLLSPIATAESGSDYGDFASDEEEIINHLLGNIAPPSPSSDAPLLVTAIEDYEEPRGVHLPKVLGVGRSTPWEPQVQFQYQAQTVRDGDSSQSTSYALFHVALVLTG
jgi:hypothetical protein